MTEHDPNEILVNELGGRIANLTVEAASWRVRALLAEEKLAEAEKDENAQDGEATPVG